MHRYYTRKVETFEEMVGVTVEGVVITDEHVEKMQDARRALDTYLDRLEEEVGAPCELWYEQRVEFSPRLPTAFGTCDVIVRCGNVLGILDWKFGQSPVRAEENPQLCFYAHGVLSSMQELTTGVDAIELAIIQPDLGDNMLNVWPTTREDLERFEVKLLSAVAEAEAEEPRCQTGPHCQYCPLEFICPEKQDLAARAVRACAEQLDMANLTYWLEHSSELESFVSAVRARALEFLESGVQVPGFKLVERRANRTWRNEAEMVAFVKELGYAADDCYDRKPKSPAQIEKLIKPETLPEDLVEKKSSGTTVAPLSDRRQDLNANNLSALKKLAHK